MRKGMLWFDDRKNISTAQKIEGAVLFFQEKYGSKPGCCYINPGISQEELHQQQLGLRIEKSRYVMPNHFILETDH